MAYFRGMLVDDRKQMLLLFSLWMKENFVKLYSNETKYAIEMQSGTDPLFFVGMHYCNTDEKTAIISCSGKAKTRLAPFDG